MIPASLFIDKASIRRATKAQNTMGAMTNTLAAAHLVDIPCRLDFLRSRREVAPNVTGEAGDPLIFFEAGRDIIQGDIVSLSAQDGRSLTIQVISAQLARGHGANHMEVIGKLKA